MTMQQPWQDFLREQRLSSASTGKAAFLTDATADATAYALINVTGKDAATFLQAQLSNNVASLANAQSCLAAWCDAKGRVLALLRVFRHADGFYLVLPADIKDAIFKRLRMFVLRAKVELEDSGSQACIGLFGTQADAVLKNLDGSDELVEAPDCKKFKNSLCLRMAGKQPAYLFFAGPEQCKALWLDLAPHCDIAAFNDWQHNQILAGQPQVFAATQSEFIPQMLNLHWLGAIDFQKGCYPGQEVVARLQYRGKLKRRMYLTSVADAAPLTPGEAVINGTGDTIGQVVYAAPSEAGQQLLAVLQVEQAAHAHVGGTPLELLELPYLTRAV